MKTSCSDSSSGVVDEFLTGAGATPLLAAHQSSEMAFTKGVDGMRQDVQTCVLLLGHYSTMYGLYPISAKGKHRTVKCIQWMKKIADNFDVDACQAVLQEFNALYDGGEAGQSDSVRTNFNVNVWAF